MAPFSRMEIANGASLAAILSAYDFTGMCRYSPFLLAMMDSTIDFTFGSVAGPETLMSNVRLPAAGSDCSEITEKGCEFERVGAGAVPHAASANTKSKTIAVFTI